MWASCRAVGVATGLLLAVEEAWGISVQKCQTGAADILGTRKAFAVQVCNLFGNTCVLNHPATAAENCDTEALSIASGECKLYPIFEYQDRAVRSGSSAVELMSSLGNLGCSVSSSNGVYSWSGACVSVQCALGDNAFAGPAMTKTGSGNSRTVGVTDTSTATFKENTLAELPDEADQIKTAFLVRTGDYVATSYAAASGGSGSDTYSVGSLPTSDGNNYGPVACPSTGSTLDSTAAAGITAENLRMCGSTGKWVYYNALNFLVDASHYASYDNNAGSSNNLNIGSVPFLYGKSAYRSGAVMAEARKVYLHSANTASSAALMTSEAITPSAGDVAPFKDEIAGTWRNYGVAFYCDKYDRTDLTACPEGNRKMFYVCDPNPNACYGSSATGAADNSGGGNGNDGAGGGGGGGVEPAAASGAECVHVSFVAAFGALMGFWM